MTDAKCRQRGIGQPSGPQESHPICSAPPGLICCGVAHQWAVNTTGETSFEAAQRFSVAFTRKNRWRMAGYDSGRCSPGADSGRVPGRKPSMVTTRTMTLAALRGIGPSALGSLGRRRDIGGRFGDASVQLTVRCTSSRLTLCAGCHHPLIGIPSALTPGRRRRRRCLSRTAVRTTIRPRWLQLHQLTAMPRREQPHRSSQFGPEHQSIGGQRCAESSSLFDSHTAFLSDARTDAAEELEQEAEPGGRRRWR